MPRLAAVESRSCILLLSFDSAYYLSSSGGFHGIKATKGRSLGGSYIYIYISYVNTYIHVYIRIYIYIYLVIWGP